jgi:hypothetical protein
MSNIFSDYDRMQVDLRNGRVRFDSRDYRDNRLNLLEDLQDTTGEEVVQGVNEINGYELDVQAMNSRGVIFLPGDVVDDVNEILDGNIPASKEQALRTLLDNDFNRTDLYWVTDPDITDY